MDIKGAQNSKNVINNLLRDIFELLFYYLNGHDVPLKQKYYL